MTRAVPIGQRERDLQTAVLELAKWGRWRAYHTHDSRRSHAGFPDLVLVRGNRIVFAELKSPTGKPTTEQVEWLADLQSIAALPTHPKGARVEAYLWYPADWPAIVKVLA